MFRPLSIAIAALFFVVGVGDAAAKSKRKRPNMPRGWSWPPNKAMKKAGKKCKVELTAAGVKWKRGKRTKGIATPVVVPSMNFAGLEVEPIFRKPPFVLDCHLALALARQAPMLRTLGIAKLRFSSIYSYRKVRKNGKTHSSLSRHALGLAIDVYRLVTTSGVEYIVKDDYSPLNMQLLFAEIAMRNGGNFRAVITPGNDPVSHYDHFHLSAKMPLAKVRKRRPSRTKKRKRKRRRKKRRRKR